MEKGPFLASMVDIGLLRHLWWFKILSVASLILYTNSMWDAGKAKKHKAKQWKAAVFCKLTRDMLIFSPALFSLIQSCFCLVYDKTQLASLVYIYHIMTNLQNWRHAVYKLLQSYAICYPSGTRGMRCLSHHWLSYILYWFTEKRSFTLFSCVLFALT